MRANKTSTPRVSAETSTQKEKADTAQPQVASNATENGGQGVFLLLTMLSRTVPLAFAVDPTERKRLENAVTGLVQAVDPQDGLEIMAATQLAALNLASLDSLARAANCPSDSRARDLNLRYGIKAASACTELLKAIDARRSQVWNSVSVGSVKLEPGARVIIGNIDTADSQANDAKPSAIEGISPDKSAA